MIDNYIKDHAMKMARQRGISVGRLFANWVLQDLNGSQPNDDEFYYDNSITES